MTTSEPPVAPELGATLRVRRGRRLIALALAVVVIASLAVWLVSRERLPPALRLATAARGDFHYRSGELLAPHLAEHARRPVEVVATAGTLENQDLLRAGGVHFAILQDGAGSLDGLVAVAPLYHEALQVIVRRDRGYRSLGDLAGARLALGPPGSGTRATARDVLAHYGIDDSDHSPALFTELANDPALDAALATTGLLNPDLGRLLRAVDLELLAVSDADALAILHPHFVPFTLPRGLYRENPAVPAEDVPTLAVKSFLAVRSDAPSALVKAALESLYEEHLRRDVPALIPRGEAEQWNELPLHPEARRYFHPYETLGVLANFVQSLEAMKELLVALGAGLYLVWMRWRSLRERELQAALRADKERLDVFLEKTIAIERRLLGAADRESLATLLHEVTAIKLQALGELTHESLRGDVTFTIFLQQCGDVIRKIQAELHFLGEAEAPGKPPPTAPA